MRRPLGTSAIFEGKYDRSDVIVLSGLSAHQMEIRWRIILSINQAIEYLTSDTLAASRSCDLKMGPIRSIEPRYALSFPIHIMPSLWQRLGIQKTSKRAGVGGSDRRLIVAARRLNKTPRTAKVLSTTSSRQSISPCAPESTNRARSASAVRRDKHTSLHHWTRTTQSGATYRGP